MEVVIPNSFHRQDFRMRPIAAAVLPESIKWVHLTMGNGVHLTGFMVWTDRIQMLSKEPLYCMATIVYQTKKFIRGSFVIVMVARWCQNPFLKNFRGSLKNQKTQFCCGSTDEPSASLGKIVGVPLIKTPVAIVSFSHCMSFPIDRERKRNQHYP